MSTENERTVSKIAMALIEAEQNPNSEVIRKKVIIAANTVFPDKALDFDIEDLIREIEAKCSIYIEGATILEDSTNHEEWLREARTNIEWNFWRRYRKYIEEQKGYPPAVVARLDELTDMILEKLENPNREGSWDNRGMVVGRVQSGKTANYTGVICKAIDSGYKVIIILSGMHKSLRSQTQLRIDEGVLGFDTQRSRSFENNYERIGVGKLFGEELLRVHPLTNSSDSGDFNKKFAQQASPTFGGEPVVLVIKKNKSVLENIRQWALSVQGTEDPTTGKRIIRNIPLLVIDDEADNASINTKKVGVDESGNQLDDYDVSAINGKIRELLSIFSQSAYIAYTATPFANIFISSDNKTETHGADIFPRNFIINLPTPSNYIGPAKVFGINPDPDSGIEASPRLPIVREVKDYEDAFPLKHKKDHEPEELPDSLKEALHSFVLACAARRAGGHVSAHNSMLVHVTRYTLVQGKVSEMLKEALHSIHNRLELGDGNAPFPILDELEELWRTDFERTTSQMSEYDPILVSWEAVKEQLFEATSRIVIRTMNGTAKDALEYEEYKDQGLSVIAVGGDKLSRGLTLEGLSVSYYLRPAKMYDTLMQMGRWFGYRPGYLNLCRIYTTPQLIAWYEHVTLASEELLLEFDNMARTGGTPQDYGLRVRTHSEGLLITSLNKMRTGQEVPISYEGDLVELPHYYKDASINYANFLLADEFVKQLGSPISDSKDYIWRGIPGSNIAGFIEGLTTHPYAIKADSHRLARYIKGQMRKGELLEWSVLLVSNKETPDRDTLGGLDVGLISRNSQDLEKEVYSLKKSHLISPPDEYKDLSNEEVANALEETGRRWSRGEIKGKSTPKKPTGKVIRSLRDPKKGTLLLYPLAYKTVTESEKPIIGYAISFPSSKTAEKITYRMNEVAIDNDDTYDED